MGDVVLTVTRTGINEEALDIVSSLTAVTIYAVVYGALVAFLPYLEVHDIFSYVNLFCYACDLVLAVAIEDDDVIDVGTVAYVFSFLESRADEALMAVDVEFLVGFSNFCRLDGVKIAYFSEARMFGAVFFLEVLKPLACHIDDAVEVMLYLGYLVLYPLDEFLCLVLGEFQYSLHLYLHEA